ncbi:hypothetical protein T310_5383 [Rasamsonia emersonii CBS 393.64]|uniref:Uncharacterized protein n=1 Tax=Rasamsonia emersonii (strain ATCC 16479 / CBS 393.64 / IMI 116815) TaxID=1408163 RepID=A0A0F4YQP8_RASE3|nr:hypothetical protein T310_5383 [Rasamsonia emersonii CBS 393.64]KKA20607.1 hypothetical protein T310_5383 [Rasamsonia emersonii CBS 393.64]
MASFTITTFNGLRCTKVPRTDVFTATLTSDTTAPAVTDQSSTTSVEIRPDPASTTAASSTGPNSDSSTTAAASNPGGDEPAASATALPQTASPGAGGPHSSLQSIRAAIGGSLGAVALVALAFLIWYLLRRRRHRIPRPAADFYGGEKLGGQTRTQAGGRNQQLQEVAARLTRPLTGAAQAIREAASQMKTRTGQMMREGPTTRFKSKTMPMPVVSPPLSETLVARSNQEEKQGRTRNHDYPTLLPTRCPREVSSMTTLSLIQRTRSIWIHHQERRHRDDAATAIKMQMRSISISILDIAIAIAVAVSTSSTIAAAATWTTPPHTGSPPQSHQNQSGQDENRPIQPPPPTRPPPDPQARAATHSTSNAHPLPSPSTQAEPLTA